MMKNAWNFATNIVIFYHKCEYIFWEKWGSNLKQIYEGQVMIECPNTIFHLYVNTEDELSRIELFMHNIRRASHVSLNDIYTWCIRHKIVYKTSFNFHKGSGLWRTLRSYFDYTKIKMKYRMYLPA